MELKAFLGMLTLAVWIGGGYLRVRARRRSGKVSSFGHPVLDQLLLLASGILLAGLMAVLIPLMGWRSHPVRGRFLLYPAVFLAGGLLTWLSSKILRSRKRR